MNAMKLLYAAIVTVSIAGLSCRSSKTYFTPQIRTKVENAGINLNKIQFYVDRDMELKREITKEEASVTKGKVKIIDGKYINIIDLEKYTPGICSATFPDKILVSFETGENKALTFGKTRDASATDPYKILAFEWYDNGEICVSAYYVNGKLHGEYLVWDESGKKIRDESYAYGIALTKDLKIDN